MLLKVYNSGAPNYDPRDKSVPRSRFILKQWHCT